MKSRFFYPTKKNVLKGFIFAQLLPVILLGLVKESFDLLTWIQFELVIIGCLCLWQAKPVNELDEREKEITLKWKSRILDYSSVFVLIPIITLSFFPEVEGWTLYNMTAIPVFLVFVFCSLLNKKELGYFFVE